MIKAINIETEEQFNWMIREMEGLNQQNDDGKLFSKRRA